MQPYKSHEGGELSFLCQGAVLRQQSPCDVARHACMLSGLCGLAAVAPLQEPWIVDPDTSLPRIHIGICAMDKKAHSRPMKVQMRPCSAYVPAHRTHTMATEDTRHAW